MDSELSAVDKYQLLRDISFKIKDTLDLNVILNLLLDSLKTVIDYDAAGIFVLSEAIDHPDYHFPGQKIGGIAKRGYESTPLESDKMLSEGKGIIDYVINSKESLIIDDVRKDDRYVIGRKKTLSELAIALPSTTATMSSPRLATGHPPNGRDSVTRREDTQTGTASLLDLGPIQGFPRASGPCLGNTVVVEIHEGPAICLTDG